MQMKRCALSPAGNSGARLEDTRRSSWYSLTGSQNWRILVLGRAFQAGRRRYIHSRHWMSSVRLYLAARCARFAKCVGRGLLKWNLPARVAAAVQLELSGGRLCTIPSSDMSISGVHRNIVVNSVSIKDLLYRLPQAVWPCSSTCADSF